jgi:hypothetical protein
MKFLFSLVTLSVLGSAIAVGQDTSSVRNAPDLVPRGPLGTAQKLFNGKDLSGWQGNLDLWTVKDGAITGTTTAEKPLKHNTFLVWTDGEVDNFELTFKYRIVNGNSGVQYRSRVQQPGEMGPIVSGYQADFEAGTTYSGILYEERGRGILAKRGEKTVIKKQPKDPADPKSPGFKIEVLGSVGDSAAIQASIKKEDWNEYKVIAKGNHLQHFINGKQTVDVTDEDTQHAAKDGILALQLHAGPPMTVQFKDLLLKELK